MREILFRGKQHSYHSEGWKEGSLIFYPDVNRAFISSGEYKGFGGFHEVKKDTVGQFTGLTDKNGKKIFEGDIVKNDWCFAYGNSVVKFGAYKPLDMTGKYQQGHLGFHLEHTHKVDKQSMRSDLMFFANKCEIIGNIHDNPELLKEGNNNVQS